MINININSYNPGYAQQPGRFPGFGAVPSFNPAVNPVLGNPMGGGYGCPCSGGFTPSLELMQGGLNGMQGFVPLSGFSGGNGLAGMAGLGAMMGGVMSALNGFLPGTGGPSAQVPQNPQFGKGKLKRLKQLLHKGQGKGKKAQKAQAQAFRQIRNLMTGPLGLYSNPKA